MRPPADAGDVAVRDGFLLPTRHSFFTRLLYSARRVPIIEKSNTMATRKSSDDSGDIVTIKKYANRRLYDTRKSTYITLDDLARMVRTGQ